jgi:hypothetical protein
MFARLNQINAEPDLYILGVFLFGIFVSIMLAAIRRTL